MRTNALKKRVLKSFWGVLVVVLMSHAALAQPASKHHRATISPSLVYLQPGGDSEGYLESLRLQNLDQLDIDRVLHLAELSGRPKLRRAAHRIADLATQEAEAYRTL